MLQSQLKVTDAAVVILNYNGLHFLQKFLAQIVTYSAPYTVWVADNASTDESITWLQANFPSIRLIEIPDNKGYAGGYNYALSQIDATYYILLNSDIEVTENWISPVLEFMMTDERIAACQPKIRAYNNRSHFEYAGAAGGYMDFLGYPFTRGRLFDTCEEDVGQYDDTADVFWATGACLFVRADAFHAMGGFDERFFAHMEEIDLCWRMLDSGYRITYCGYTTVYHVGGGTLHKSNPKKTFLNYRNNLLMLYKNMPIGRRWKTILMRLVLDGISSVRFMAAGSWPDVWSIIKAHFAFYSLIPQLSKGLKRTTYRAPLYYKSVVWEYFVNGKHIFSDLPGIFIERQEKITKAPKL